MTRRRRLIPILALSFAAAGLVILFITLDSVYGDPDGFTFGRLSWAAQIFDAKALHIPNDVAQVFGVYAGFHIGLDLVFMAVYGSLDVLLIGIRKPSSTRPEAAIQKRRVRLTIVVAVLIGVDLLEDALMWGAGGFAAAGEIPTAYGDALGAVTVAKWLLVLFVFVSIPPIPWTRICRRLTGRVA